MSWIKLDDQWMDHPKFIKAGRDARDVWLASVTWCAKYSTDGFFPIELLPSLAVTAGVDVANCQSFASILLDVCLWDAIDNQYHVHDFLVYNPSKEQVEQTRSERRIAGKAGGKAKASKLLANSQANAIANSYQNSAPSPSPLEGSAKNALPLHAHTPKPPRTFKPPVVSEQVQKLQEHFIAKTGLPEPLFDKRTSYAAWQKQWHAPLSEILTLAGDDVEVAEEIITASLAKLTSVTVADPNSIIKTARAVSAKTKRNGGRPDWLVGVTEVVS